MPVKLYCGMPPCGTHKKVVDGFKSIRNITECIISLTDPLVTALIDKEKLKRREKLVLDEIGATTANERNGLGP